MLCQPLIECSEGDAELQRRSACTLVGEALLRGALPELDLYLFVAILDTADGVGAGEGETTSTPCAAQRSEPESSTPIGPCLFASAPIVQAVAREFCVPRTVLPISKKEAGLYAFAVFSYLSIGISAPISVGILSPVQY